MKTGRILQCIAFALVAALPFSGAKAADWKPTSDVEFVIPYGLGGGADLLARVIIKIMADEKLVPVNVTAVNKPGGGASVGVAYVLDHEERQSEHAGAVQSADPDHAADGEGCARLARPDAGDEPDARRLPDLRRQGLAVQDRRRPGEGRQGQAAQDGFHRLRRHGRRHGDRGVRGGVRHPAQRRALQFRRRGADRADRRPRQPRRRQSARIHGLPHRRTGSRARRLPSDPLRRSAQRADDEGAGHRRGAVPDVARRGIAQGRFGRRGGLLAGRDAEGRRVQGVHRLHQAERGDAARGQRPGLHPSSWNPRRRSTRTC